MNLLSVIPIGKENKLNRKELMYAAKIVRKEKFISELQELRKEKIIAYDEGYYIPANEKEYQEIIDKLEKIQKDTQKVINMAKEQMKRGNVL